MNNKETILDLIEVLIILGLFLGMIGIYFDIPNAKQVFNVCFLLFLGYGLKQFRTMEKK